ncbi:MAG: sulfurtransferase TusA family protein [Planctomycetes bacterium]|nr:sulfurtransferase TusA family protein [Planctomycetota bacterium]
MSEPVDLDLRGVVCPVNYAKIMIRLQALSPGGRLTAIIDDGLPIKFVPHSAQQDGHRVIETTQLESGHWRVVIERGGLQNRCGPPGG